MAYFDINQIILGVFETKDFLIQINFGIVDGSSERGVIAQFKPEEGTLQDF